MTLRNRKIGVCGIFYSNRRIERMSHPKRKIERGSL